MEYIGLSHVTLSVSWLFVLLFPVPVPLDYFSYYVCHYSFSFVFALRSRVDIAARSRSFSTWASFSAIAVCFSANTAGTTYIFVSKFMCILICYIHLDVYSTIHVICYMIQIQFNLNFPGSLQMLPVTLTFMCQNSSVYSCMTSKYVMSYQCRLMSTPP